ncbi:tRNA (adenine(22)-N(1))-methyltransferase [Bacillus alkalicellulosilyticus]|uniref:tRNA (adenine(22)-N(1))-methyltransferase n=1 Tax=Alkalihalobacterium alkalicellulosilyticum TaxID=1912214 RepID=UPI0009975C5D|nr:tRNA (adenine(22)-N(1))-methyltransferase TrmK [Bacillus alkalicellulosilyticus]
MNENKLSKRLERVASFVPNGSSLADIGSDHAYLPCYLCIEGKITKAIAGEVNEGPFQSAKSQVEKSGLSNKITVRKGDGLEVVSPGEIDVVTICGMGGALITDILDAGIKKLEGVSTLILQPNVGADKIRRWLRRHQWELVEEEILEEDDKVYEILVAQNGNGDTPYTNDDEIELLLGPFLMKQKNQAFIKKWKSELVSWNLILAQFDQAKQTKEVIQKRDDLQRKINEVEEVLADE